MSGDADTEHNVDVDVDVEADVEVEAEGAQGAAAQPGAVPDLPNIHILTQCISGAQLGIPCKYFETPEVDAGKNVYTIALELNGTKWACRLVHNVLKGTYSYKCYPVYKRFKIYRYGRLYIVTDGKNIEGERDPRRLQAEYPLAPAWAVAAVFRLLAQELPQNEPIVGMTTQGWRDVFGIYKYDCHLDTLKVLNQLPTPHHKALALAYLTKYISPVLSTASRTYVDRAVFVYGRGREGKTTLISFLLDITDNHDSYYVLNQILATQARVRNLMAFYSTPAVIDEFQFDESLLSDKSTLSTLRDLVMSAVGAGYAISAYAAELGWRTQFFKTRTPIFVGNADPLAVLRRLMGRSTIEAVSRRVAIIDFEYYVWRRGPLHAGGNIVKCIGDIWQKHMAEFLWTHDFVETAAKLAEILNDEYGIDLRDGVSALVPAENFFQSRGARQAIIEAMLDTGAGRFWYERVAANLNTAISNGCIRINKVRDSEEERRIAERLDELVRSSAAARELMKYIGHFFGVRLTDSPQGGVAEVDAEAKLTLYLNIKCFNFARTQIPAGHAAKIGGTWYYRLTLNEFIELLTSAEEEPLLPKEGAAQNGAE